MANPQLGDSQKLSYSLSELDAAGNPATPLPNDLVTVISSDTNMATVVPDAVPVVGTVASGFIVAGKKLGTVEITFTVLHQNSSLPAVAPVIDKIDIVGGLASTLSVSLGTPVAQ